MGDSGRLGERLELLRGEIQPVVHCLMVELLLIGSGTSRFVDLDVIDLH